MSKPDHSVFIIGLDGATFNLMLPWIDEGLLPNLKRLIDEGTHSRLQSTTPPITPCAWSSFMTGKNPGKHGLFDFVEPETQTHGFQFTNASCRRSETLWGCLSRHGKQVGAVNVPMTYPPEPVNGYLISGLDTPHEGSPYTYPLDLKSELKSAGIPYRVDLRHLGDMRTDRLRDRRVEDLREMESIRTDAMQYLRRKYPADCNMVVYIASDQVQHHFWHYMDTTHDKHDAEGAIRYGNVIRDMYIHLDGLIGKLLEDIDDDTVVIVMSDHGFGPTRKTRVRLNEALAQAGLLTFTEESSAKKRYRGAIGLLERMLRSTLSPKFKAWVAAQFPRLRTWVESADVNGIDWSRTMAYANETYCANPAVWLNRTHPDIAENSGVENSGVENSGDENNNNYEKVLDEVESVLREIKDPTTGKPVISNIVRSRDIHSGPYLSKAPDLLLSWWEDGFLLDRSRQNGSSDHAVVFQSSEAVSGGVEFTGSHMLDGILIMHGGPVRSTHELSHAEIIDVAPTILYLMGLPIPDDMDGKVLLDALNPEFVQQHTSSLEVTESGSNQTEPPASSSSMSEEDSERVRERLRALGYID